jgi:hypothetical protein
VPHHHRRRGELVAGDDRAQVKAVIIAQREARGDWTFAYLGVGPDRWTRETGMAAGSVALFSVADPRASLNVASEATRQFRASRQRSTRSFFAPDEADDSQAKGQDPT